MNKVTPWYEPDQKPVRVGYYQRKYILPTSVAVPDYWDGQKWIMCDSYGIRIENSRALMPWRGLRSQHE